jgi:diguanylate cyclase (GGDEF)-like protein
MARRTTVANREQRTPSTGPSGAAVDVGAPRRATGARRDSEARLQALLSSLDDLVFELDEDGTYLGIWTADDTLLAAPRSELLGRTVRELLGDEIGLCLTSIIGHVLETGCSETCEYSLKVPAGTRCFQARIAPIAASQSLPRSVCLLVRDITLQKLIEVARDQAEAQLRHQALYDGLTGVANRLALMDRLSQALAALDRNHGRVGLFFVDLDNFKAINDSFGHDAGDRVLVEVGRRLSRMSRRSDTVARVGGDEFVLLRSNLRVEHDARLIATRAVRAIGERFVCEGTDLTVTASIGAVVTADPFARPGVLLRQADVALYEAKGAGRDCFRIFDGDLRASAATNHDFDFDLRRAVTDNELFLLYQPLFALGNRSLRGVEALVRWRHPERGVVLPGDFIPMAETCGLIDAIDTFVLDEACRQLAQWTGEGGYPADFTVSVNMSGQQLSDPTLVDRIASTIKKHRIVPSHLCLEITETALIGELGDAATTLAALSELGVLLALDDFGTGYSTLAHLQRLNVNVLKIDRSFVEQVTGNDRDHKIVGAIIAMAHALGMSVVGEGIETDRQLEELTALGCDEGQGFLLARPVPPEQVASFARGTGDAARHSALAATAALNAGYRSSEFYLEHHKDHRAHSGAVA